MCTVALFGLTPLHLALKSKKKTSYNSVLRNLLLIKKPFSTSTMFVAHGIPSFYELLRTSIYRFADRVSKNLNSIIMACMTPIVYIHSPIRQWWRSVLYKFALFLFCDILLLLSLLLLLLLLLLLYLDTCMFYHFLYVYGRVSAIKIYYYYILI